ncbi:uncharacterized protein LOC127838163 isoform X7 [Dreissena polymorpha]|uniref:uncharacterized protein LOC127838163 isoform X7 n=1 Tax=Dreissena polymorpha TaxID=45954 RepID=UPI002264B0F1|nr:uncharacterized protein LOC127838163 isoform X7 [Dreissena polymorpha]
MLYVRVIKTKVKSELRDPADPEDFNGFYYKINKPSYSNIYKFNYLSDVSSANKARIYTSGSTAACGVYLEEGKTYILSGSVNRKKAAHGNQLVFILGGGDESNQSRVTTAVDAVSTRNR